MRSWLRLTLRLLALPAALDRKLRRLLARRTFENALLDAYLEVEKGWNAQLVSLLTGWLLLKEREERAAEAGGFTEATARRHLAKERKLLRKTEVLLDEYRNQGRVA